MELDTLSLEPQWKGLKNVGRLGSDIQEQFLVCVCRNAFVPPRPETAVLVETGLRPSTRSVKEQPSATSSTARTSDDLSH